MHAVYMHIVTVNVPKPVTAILTLSKMKNNLMYVIASRSRLELMKMFCSVIDIAKINFMSIEESDESDAFIITPLHVAVQRGHYGLVDYLLKKLEGKLTQLRYLIHFCVYLSAYESQAIVENKIQIIKLLVKKNKEWIDEQLIDRTTSLLQEYVHANLIQCLIQEGAKNPTENWDESSLSVQGGYIEHLVVGNEPCTLLKVVDVIHGGASDGELSHKLQDIAKSLQISNDSMNELRIFSKTLSCKRALFETLKSWRQKSSDDATLQKLIKALENNGLVDCADALRIHFDDEKKSKYIVPEHLKAWMNNKIAKFKRNEVKIDFQELTSKLAVHVDETTIHERPAETHVESVQTVEKKLLVVGDELCPLLTVLDVIHGNSSDDELSFKLQDIAKSLQISNVRMNELRLFFKTLSCKSALFEILELWRQKSSYDATLQNLIKALENNGLTHCADSLRIKFQEFDDAFGVSGLKQLKRTAEMSTWKKLPDHLKHWMNSKTVKFQGAHVKLKELTAQIATPVDEKILDELGKGNIPCIVSEQEHELLDYYVHRTVGSRKVLKIDVLKEKCKDVFVIEGLEQYKLSSLISEDELTDVSGNQRQRVRLTVRFILLEHESDFTKICELTSSPVHWLKYKNDRLELIKSSGPVKNLQKHIDSMQYSFPEDYLASRPERVIIIADSPGMGKTSLLTNIAQRISKKQPTVLVRFIVFKECIDALGKKKEKISVDSIVKVIAERSSDFEFGKKLIENTLQTQTCVLLFDGFDEVLSYQTSIAKEILQAAVKLPSSKVFVATRLHFRDEVENNLHVLSYKIQPFDESNQIMFLIKFWRMEGVTSNESLKKFTYECVKRLSSKMTEFGKGIAGIPLQCKLLAEVYKEHVIRCSELGNYAYDNSIVMIDSMFKLYKGHMDLRFKDIQEQESRVLSSYEIIKQVHMYFALELLFPEHSEKFKHLNHSSIPLHDLCGLGIIEATHSNDTRFVHRTFAEFLVAWLVHESLINKSPDQHVLNPIIFELTRQNVHLYVPLTLPVNLKSFQFDFSVICYFLDGFAKSDNLNENTIDYHEEALPFYIASAFHNYEGIPTIVTHPCTRVYASGTSYLRDLLYIIARYSCLEIMEAILISSKTDITQIDFISSKKTAWSEAFKITPLHVAIERGNFRLVDYLLKKLKEKASQLHYLIHFCVNGSALDSNVVVKEKFQIVKKLCEINKEWIEEQLLDQSTPLLQYYIHPDLLECLIEEGANLNIIDEDGNTVLHKITERNRWTGKSYDRIVIALNKRGFQHFNKPNKQHITPLHLAICAAKQVELLESTLTLFASKEGNFNAVDEQGDSVLFYAIREKRSMKLIKTMLNLGAIMKQNQKGENILHISVQQRNLNALKYFIETQNNNVNDQDVYGKTPLHLAICAVKDEELLRSTLALFASNGVNFNAVDQQGDSVLFYGIREKRSVELISKMISLGADTKYRNQKGENILHISVQQRNLNALKYFIESQNISVNEHDENGDTPLHLSGLQSRRFIETESMQLLLMNARANVNAVNKLHSIPFIYAFERGQGLSLNVIKEMEKHGLEITVKVASTALTAAFRRLETIPHANTPLDLLEYLIKKGGEVNFGFSENFWNWAVVRERIPHIIQHIHITSDLLIKAKETSLLTELQITKLQNLHHSSKSEEFIKMVQNKPGSFERVYIILRSEQQTRAVEELRKCLPK